LSLPARFLPRFLHSLLLPGALLLVSLGCTFGRSEDCNCTPATADYSISLNVPVITIPAGGGGDELITALRLNGFQGAISLWVAGVPAGVSCVGGPIPAGSANVHLPITVAATVAPQRVNGLVVQGTSGGLVRTCTFDLIITAPLPLGAIRGDLAQASGATQQAADMVNVALALEPVTATTAKDVSAATEVRHAFTPAPNPN
jgi:hypothetical protein